MGWGVILYAGDTHDISQLIQNIKTFDIDDHIGDPAPSHHQPLDMSPLHKSFSIQILFLQQMSQSLLIYRFDENIIEVKHLW